MISLFLILSMKRKKNQQKKTKQQFIHTHKQFIVLTYEHFFKSKI